MEPEEMLRLLAKALAASRGKPPWWEPSPFPPNPLDDPLRNRQWAKGEYLTLSASQKLYSTEMLWVPGARLVAVEYNFTTVDGNDTGTNPPQLSFETAVTKNFHGTWKVLMAATSISSPTSDIPFFQDSDTTPPLTWVRWKLENQSTTDSVTLQFDMDVQIS